MNDKASKKFSPEEIDALRDRLEAHRMSVTPPISWTTLQKETGQAAGTLSQWVPGTYNNGKLYDNHLIPAAIERFFLLLEERRQLMAIAPTAPSFQKTETAGRVLSCLGMAQVYGEITLISTPPGCGKTYAWKHYRDTRPNIFGITVTQARGGVQPVLIALLGKMGEPDARGTPHAMVDRIAKKALAVSKPLIVVDEAQYLTPVALEELRGLHDETGCGLALIGDTHLPALVKEYAQFHSRIGSRHVQKKGTPSDVELLLSAWGIDGAAERSFLLDMAKRSGALRTIDRTMDLAFRAVRQDGATLDLQLLKQAYAQRYAEGV